jgi:dGTPase
MQVQDLRLDSFAALEGQIASLADDIAYNNHDIDDGLRARHLTLRQIEEVPIAGRALAAITARHGQLSESQLVYEMNRRMIAAMVEDVLAETRRRLAAFSPHSADDIREAREPVVAFSESMAHEISELRRFLHSNLYRHPTIETKMAKAKLMIERLYAHFSSHYEDFPDLWQREAAASDPIRARRLAGDFVAGMTDRYALLTHARLFDAPAELV